MHNNAPLPSTITGAAIASICASEESWMRSTNCTSTASPRSVASSNNRRNRAANREFVIWENCCSKRSMPSSPATELPTIFNA